MTVSDDFDPLDELASAHLDGEPLPDDVVTVPGSDFLDDRIAVFRSVSDLLATDLPSPEPQVRRTHLAAALGAFDQLTWNDDTPTVGTDPIADPSGVSGTPDATGDGSDQAGADRTGETGSTTPGPAPDVGGSGASVTSLTSHRRRRGMPAWLGAAAAVVLVGAAGIALSGLGDDDSEMTTAAPLAADEGDMAESADLAEFDAAAPADGAAGDEAAPDAAATRMEDDGSADTTMVGGGLAEEESADEDSVESSAAPPDLARVPSIEEMDALAETSLLPLDLALCGVGAEPGDDSRPPVGFVPVTIAGEPAEILVYGSEPEARSFVVVDERCDPVS